VIAFRDRCAVSLNMRRMADPSQRQRFADGGKLVRGRAPRVCGGWTLRGVTLFSVALICAALWTFILTLFI
jgi:hypothetical protein